MAPTWFVAWLSIVSGTKWFSSVFLIQRKDFLIMSLHRCVSRIFSEFATHTDCQCGLVKVFLMSISCEQFAEWDIQLHGNTLTEWTKDTSVRLSAFWPMKMNPPVVSVSLRLVAMVIFIPSDTFHAQFTFPPLHSTVQHEIAKCHLFLKIKQHHY